MFKTSLKPLLFITLFLSLPLLISCSEASTDNSDSGNPNGNLGDGEGTSNDQEKEWTLVWSDEFDTETLDTDKWSYQFGDGCPNLCGWGNEELQSYTDRMENIFIKDNMLHIVANKESYDGKDYTSARIRTIGKGDWVYGRIEVRAKSPKGQGIWPAIWMLPTGEGKIWPRDGEIDIMELVGHEPETVHGTVHFGGDWPDHEFEGTSYSLADGTFADDFHVFSIEWKLNEIKFFVDDNHFFTVTPATVTQHGFSYPFNSTFHLIMNVAVGGNWPGSPDASTEFPQSMIVDYVRVYQLQ